MPTIDDYLTKVTPSQKAEFERIRAIVRQLVPDAEEVISYGMPAFKYNKQYVIWFGAFKNHMSIFPTPHPIEEMKGKLDKFAVAKGTLQFTEQDPIPESTLKEIITTRLKSISKPQPK
ncbi:MAG TPA: DUF1801 domain-containing protein [Candidatus Saccharimonadales bacterium]|jgi:uncharacterized protein YdhG (YjbR/CyaY superfamily)|nr:DUF1801 domain-containing protein [Candidatus Saccharimonadales bacterium]